MPASAKANSTARHDAAVLQKTMVNDDDDDDGDVDDDKEDDALVEYNKSIKRASLSDPPTSKKTCCNCGTVLCKPGALRTVMGGNTSVVGSSSPPPLS